MSRMLKSAGAMAAATMTSRLLGMAREMAYAAFMGNTAVASAFTLAFQVPNLFRRLLGEGALTAAFIPIFKRKQETESEAATWAAANAVISGLLVAAGAVTVLTLLGISLVLGSFPGLKAETRLMLELLRMMFPYMLLVCLAAVLIGMANSRGHFFIPALGAAVINVVMIGSVFLLAPLMGSTLEEQIRGLAIGVLLAGVAQVAFQVPSLRADGYRYRWVSPWRDPTAREVVIKMLPGSIGVAAFQINVLVTNSFSFWFEPTIVSTFNYAVRLMELPQGLFGISLATYLLPTLSSLATRKQFPEFRQTLNQGLVYLAFANLLATALSIGLAAPIVRLVFEHGKFTPEATWRVSLALACLAPGLLFFSMNNILARAFFALDDIRTPMRISLVCLMLNLGFSFWLVQDYREAGLGVANTLTAALNTGLLVYALKRKLGRLDWTGLRQALLVLVPAAALAGAAAWVLGGLWQRHVGQATLPQQIGHVFLPMAVATALYWAAAVGGKVEGVHEITALIRRKLRR